jgi:hypothetical protein
MMICDRECETTSAVRDFAELIHDENPRLSPQAVTDYAQRICEAEAREDHALMHKLFQEALYSWGEEGAA